MLCLFRTKTTSQAIVFIQSILRKSVSLQAWDQLGEGVGA